MIRRAVLAEKGDIMHTYIVEQVAGSWLLKNKSGEAIFVADSYEDAVALATALLKRCAGQPT